jgi:hypothetical protein
VRTSGHAVLCIAHVTDTMGQIEGDFEKGAAGGTAAALRVLEAVATACIRNGAVSLPGKGPTASRAGVQAS